MSANLFASTRIAAIDGMPLALSELAGRVLKISGHPQPPPSKGPPSEVHLSQGRAASCLPSTPSGPEGFDSRGMVGGGSGDFRGQLMNFTSWAKTRPLSDIHEITEPSLADTVPRRLLSGKQLPRSASRNDLTRKPSVASRRPSLDTRFTENKEPDRKTSIDSNGVRSAYRGRSSQTAGEAS